MKYTVLLSRDAQQELEAAHQWLAERTPQHAPEWHDRLIDALVSLEENPERCPIRHRDEDDGMEYRQLVFGNKRHAYLILFYIHGDQVRIGHIRHAARRD